jgi:transcriptional regulator with PAS, ATPase and Fis domain
MFRFGCIANNHLLGERLREVAQRSGDAVEVRVAALARAVPAAGELLGRGVEGLVATPGTAEILAGRFDVPVVAVYPSTLDLLRALQQAATLGARCSVSLYRGRPEGVDELGRAAGLREVRCVPYVNDEDLRHGLAQAIALGADVLVGGATTQAVASEAGRRAVMVAYGDEGLGATLDTVRALVRLRRAERQNAEELRAVLELSPDGVVVVDGRGAIVLCNGAAAAALGVTPAAALGRHLAALMPEIGLGEALRTGLPEVDRISTVNGIRVVTSCQPFRGPGGTQGAAISIKELARIQSIEDRVRRETASHRGFVARFTLDDIVAESPRMRAAVTKARHYAETDSTVLIRGESGTGKELVAQGIHRAGPRRERPFVAVNCQALPDSLLESELFGYEEGAFTGARRGGKPGLFEMAHGGTIFLDEVGGISPGVQARLLRVLQSRETMRVGGDRIVSVDVRIIAASNERLSELVRQGRFRMDLLYRLNVLLLDLPPLRERREDLPELVRHLLARFCARYGRPPVSLSARLLSGLLAYPWPGNVRQLENILERYVLLRAARPMADQEVLAELERELVWTPGDAAPAGGGPPPPLGRQLADLERQIIFRTLEASGFDRREAARRLGISVRTFWRKLERAEDERRRRPRA